jgi:hypothetical protein
MRFISPLDAAPREFRGERTERRSGDSLIQLCAWPTLALRRLSERTHARSMGYRFGGGASHVIFLAD